MKSFPRTEHVHINGAPEEVDVLKTLDEIARIEGMGMFDFMEGTEAYWLKC